MCIVGVVISSRLLPPWRAEAEIPHGVASPGTEAVPDLSEGPEHGWERIGDGAGGIGQSGCVGDRIPQAIHGLDEEARVGFRKQMAPQGGELRVEMGEEGGIRLRGRGGEVPGCESSGEGGGEEGEGRKAGEGEGCRGGGEEEEEEKAMPMGGGLQREGEEGKVGRRGEVGPAVVRGGAAAGADEARWGPPPPRLR